ncbi:class I SAM-dependent methyltransferase [Actinokineospora sp.]|uniref:class I SAM-dependent methyltransferase n=1 Tax=Actinokineospora sp. TaxID=1872133 RepID=UPI003D6BA4B1
MSIVERKLLDLLYRTAEGRPDKLPWHRDEPNRLLVALTKTAQPPGRALDIGCGSGAFADYLAARGFDVIAIDLHPDAVAMARARSAASQTPFTVLHEDVLDYAPNEPFDLILDSGCLHNMNRAGMRAYRTRLIESWLHPGAAYVLEHWTKRHPLDWRPLGPRRRAGLATFFAPELELVESYSEDMRVPLPLGPRVRGTAYHFRRAA